MRTHRWSMIMSSSALVLGLAGCTGGSNKPIPTSGVLTLDGVPIPNARVTFNPVGGGKIAFSNNSDAQGRFSLTSEDGKEGAYRGQYKITVVVTGPTQEADAKMVRSEKEILKERDRLMRQPRTKIHANYGNVDKSPLKAEIPASGDVMVPLTKNGT